MSESRFLEDLLTRKSFEFEEQFPGLSARFCRIMGRRISHIAGSAVVTGGGALRIEVLPALLMLIEGDLQGREKELRKFTSDLSRESRLSREFS